METITICRELFVRACNTSLATGRFFFLERLLVLDAIKSGFGDDTQGAYPTIKVSEYKKYLATVDKSRSEMMLRIRLGMSPTYFSQVREKNQEWVQPFQVRETRKVWYVRPRTDTEIAEFYGIEKLSYIEIPRWVVFNLDTTNTFNFIAVAVSLSYDSEDDQDGGRPITYKERATRSGMKESLLVREFQNARKKAWVETLPVFSVFTFEDKQLTFPTHKEGREWIDSDRKLRGTNLHIRALNEGSSPFVLCKQRGNLCRFKFWVMKVARRFLTPIVKERVISSSGKVLFWRKVGVTYNFL